MGHPGLGTHGIRQEFEQIRSCAGAMILLPAVRVQWGCVMADDDDVQVRCFKYFPSQYSATPIMEDIYQGGRSVGGCWLGSLATSRGPSRSER